MSYCESWSKNFEHHCFAQHLLRGRLPPLDLSKRASLGGPTIYLFLLGDKERSLGTNLSQFRKHFPHSKVHNLILNLKWLNRYTPMTRVISESNWYFHFEKLRKKAPTKRSFKWLQGSLGQAKRSRTQLCFPPNESPRYRANACES